VVGSDWLVATKVTVTEPMVAGEVVGVVTWAVRVAPGEESGMIRTVAGALSDW
jgi:hypothetical protein